jgi:hypothetical protein
VSECKILTPFGDYKTPMPSSEVIDLLRDALEKAERGEIAGVAIAMIDGAGVCRTRAVRGTRGMAEIVGAVAVMQDDLNRTWKGE